MGNPPLMGVSIWDEFLRLGSAGDYGDTRLSVSTIGTTPTLTQPVPASQLESGVLRMATGAVSANEGGTVGLPAVIYSAGPAIGAKFIAKIRVDESADYEVWSGFASSLTSGVDTTDAAEFIGFRSIGGADWQGVVKDGSGGGNESVIELIGGAGVDQDFHIFGFHYVEGYTSTASAFGVQFFVVDADMHGQPAITLVGDPVETNLPTAALYLAPLGIVSQDGTDKACEIDFYSLGGNQRR